jgi:hypothetical protein
MLGLKRAKIKNKNLALGAQKKYNGPGVSSRPVIFRYEVRSRTQGKYPDGDDSTDIHTRNPSTRHIRNTDGNGADSRNGMASNHDCDSGGLCNSDDRSVQKTSNQFSHPESPRPLLRAVPQSMALTLRMRP